MDRLIPPSYGRDWSDCPGAGLFWDARGAIGVRFFPVPGSGCTRGFLPVRRYRRRGRAALPFLHPRRLLGERRAALREALLDSAAVLSLSLRVYGPSRTLGPELAKGQGKPLQRGLMEPGCAAVPPAVRGEAAGLKRVRMAAGRPLSDEQRRSVGTFCARRRRGLCVGGRQTAAWGCRLPGFGRVRGPI